MVLILNVFRTALLVVLLLASQVVAQEPLQVDYDKWEAFAEQSEVLLDNPDTPDAELAALREDATEWRAEFDRAQNANAPRIETVQEQIEALGPAPAEGESEAEDVAARRKTLNDQLAQLQAPGLTATEAFSRANALISRSNEIQRLREAQEIAALTPSPLLPGSWVASAKDLKAVWDGMASEWNLLRASGEQLRENLLQVAICLLSAILLLTVGRRVVDSLPVRMGERASGDARAVVAFLVSLGQILLPMMGIFLLVRGLDLVGLFGDWWRPVMLSLPLGGLAFFGGRWLVRLLFSAHPIAYPTLNVPVKVRIYARFCGTGLAVALSLHVILSAAMLPLAGYVRSSDAVIPRIPYEFSEAGAGVIHFALMLAGSFFLFQLANILRRMTRYDGTDSPPYRARVLSIAGRVLRIIIVLGLLLAVLGLINLSNAIFWAAVQSTALIGLLIVLQDFIADLYALIRRGKEDARESLTPMLIGFGLILASIPLFALIWGTSTAELSEWRTSLLKGVSVGGVRLSPGGVLTFLIVFTIGYVMTRWVQSAFRNSVLPRTRLDQGAQNAAVSGLGYIGIFLAGLFAITSAGIDLSNLAIVAGALSVGIGFGMQNIVSNFVSGIILLIERPISVGDWVEAGGQQGIVQDISVRSTRIKTFDQTDVIVPNSDLISQSVTNWTRGSARGRIIVPVGVAYGTDTRRVERILREIAEDQPTVLIDPPPVVLFSGFGADSLDFEIRAILSDITGGIGVSSEIRHQIAQRFAEEGIEIPYAQRDIWLRNPEALLPGSGQQDSNKPTVPPVVHEGKPVHEADYETPVPDLRTVGEVPSGADDGDGGDGGDGGDSS
ncbi:MAG: mechanosensitive ion channel domain-containing protein [Paracoccus sp. (in: a-proteobacteria)]